ncbi:hypothetical protein [Flavobacterium aciduliphilum]|uniref:Uncharacterized protein n=1 Tax=Flavobacterium aciduliphilum TaxID=1101402 RepID=A0A328YJS2_9FLAO|nr:hypothetical protein [Flavobacterium aciduliphilum]RAR73790.1 hypothetical protein CLV55_103109 [Flavobacterium aciduliphilum]
MLNLADYNALWTLNPLGAGSFSTITEIAVAPPYADYVIRENMLEDYLDIFRGINTRNIRPFIPVGGWYYPHPFFNADGTSILVNIPCIKYILIGEACPSFGVNYFYDITMIQGQGYLKAAYDATYNGLGPVIPWAPLHHPTDKINKLLDLALRGVLLVDIFPFAIDYNTNVHHLGFMLPLREVLINTGITNSFFNDAANLYSVTNRVTEIIEEGLTCVDFMNGTNSVLIAPTKISYHLAHQINIIPLVTAPLIFTIRENSLRLMPPHIILELPHNYFYHLIPAGTSLGGVPLPLRADGIHTIKVPRYICCGYSGAGTVPHALFITNALL